MILFFDTSALVKFFHEEKGSETVTNLVLSKDNEIWISELARIEFLSAIFRRFRNREVDDEQLKEALMGFEEQLATFNVEPLGQAILREAEYLLKLYGKTRRVRALDALQLGTFNLISEKGWFFVAADDFLCEIVKEIGFETINPLSFPP
jgi:uncharacterized protein with PIN domain